MKNIWFALLGVLGVILVPPGPAQAAAPHPLLADAQTALALTKDDRILGNPDAPITIIEYASLTCPHCAHFTNEVLPELKKKWIDTGKAKLVLRDYPLDEPALRAAMIARCAPPDRFYAYTDMFFGAQDKWVTARDYRDALARLVKLGGMSREEERGECILRRGSPGSIACSTADRPTPIWKSHSARRSSIRARCRDSSL